MGGLGALPRPAPPGLTRDAGFKRFEWSIWMVLNQGIFFQVLVKWI